MKKPRPRPQPGRKPRSSGASLPPDTLDPALVAEVNRMVRGFVMRVLLQFALLAVATEIFISLRHIPNAALPSVFALAAFGIVLPFVRGADRVFKALLALGKSRLDARRFQDARYVLEYFHRFGNMSFDVAGEAHYQLVRACLGLGEMAKAGAFTDWLTRYRKRSEWTAKAQTALEAAERARLRREAPSDTAPPADTAEPDGNAPKLASQKKPARNSPPRN